VFHLSNYIYLAILTNGLRHVVIILPGDVSLNINNPNDIVMVCMLYIKTVLKDVMNKD